MNWIKRAFRSISYHKKNTILMFLSFLILSILILFGLCIRAASRERIWEIRTSIGGSVLVSNERQIYSEEPRGVNSISHQKYLELCADERIRFGSCNTVTAALADNFTAEIMDGQEENGTENIYVEGSSDPVEYFSSVSSVVTLISGHVPQNAEEAVVSDGIAERNGLGIGDTIAVLSPYTKERYTFKISGIYSTNGSYRLKSSRKFSTSSRISGSSARNSRIVASPPLYFQRTRLSNSSASTSSMARSVIS